MKHLGYGILLLVVGLLSSCDQYYDTGCFGFCVPDTVSAPHVCSERYTDSWYHEPSASLAAEREFIWPHHISEKLLFPVRFMNGSAWQQEQVKRYAVEWTKASDGKLLFKFVGQADNSSITAFRIRFELDGPSWSYIGTSVDTVDQNEETMLLGWVDRKHSDEQIRSLVLHEFGHALGFIHEHLQPEAVIPWDVPKAEAYYMALNPTWDKVMVRVNVFERYMDTEVNSSRYDPWSIMHYAIPDSITDGDFAIDLRTQLSSRDRAFLKVIYPLETCNPGEPCYIDKNGNRVHTPGPGNVTAMVGVVNIAGK